MGFLYVNSKGTPWRKHSYSAGNTFDQCPKKYYLQKILGWKEKENKAAFALGRAFETAVQHYHENNATGYIERFHSEWAQHAPNTELRYTKVEKDWSQCLRIGTDWLRLYAIRQPSLPIPIGAATIFQREIYKEVFPGDPIYGEIEDGGKLDCIAYVEPSHPMLPKLDWKPEYGPLRPLIVDYKTAGQDFPQTYGIAAFDIQLRRYSWLSGIRDVALAVFVKKSPKLQKGYSVTLLEDAGHFRAGQEAVIAGMEGDDVILVANDFMVEEMEKAQGRKKDKNGVEKPDQTKDGKARRDVWLADNGVCVPAEIVTKQRMQFNAGYVTIESADEAGEIAASQIVRIVNAWKEHERSKGKRGYPSTFKIRGMGNDLNDPYFRAFVLGDEAYRNLNFVKTDQETLDDLFADPTEGEGDSE